MYLRKEGSEQAHFIFDEEFKELRRKDTRKQLAHLEPAHFNPNDKVIKYIQPRLDRKAKGFFG